MQKANRVCRLKAASMQGSALVTALFIMTLVAIAATAMSTRLQLDIYRTRLTILSDKLYLASQGVSFWTMGILSDKKNHFHQSDGRTKVADFPNQFKAIYPDLLIQGSVYDLQARFNLNNLSDKKYYAFFLKLLKSSIPGMNAASRNNIASATRQWISPYSPENGGDKLLIYYLKQNPPYYPSQQAMESLSEFRLVRGVDAKTWQLLNDYLTVLPEVTPININTAPKNIIMSLGNGLNENQTKEIMDARGKDATANQKAIRALLQKFAIQDNQVTFESNYFMSIAVVKGDDLTLINYSIFKRRKDKNGKISVSLLAESLNSL
ncbi:MAG: type II secretion system minor pseudopilin GspK [Legionella sp.]|nr:type II secretion system minor pseudopilin GspK [Legionella sp.]